MKAYFRGIPIALAILLLLIFDYSYPTDLGFPDTVLVGNLDGTPIFLNPYCSCVNLPVWVKNDYSTALAFIPVGTEDQFISARMGGNILSLLRQWDDIDFYPPGGMPNQPQTGYTNQHMLGWSEIYPPFNSPLLNTNYQFEKVGEFTVKGVVDTTLIGDTTMIVEGYDPINGYILFCDSVGINTWNPIFVGGPIVFTDSDPPAILSSSPGPNAINVPVSANITVTFDTDMDGSSIDRYSFLVYAQSSGLLQGTISYDSVSRMAMFNPQYDLEESESFTVTLTISVRSNTGISICNSYIWSFTTGVPDNAGQFDSLIFSYGGHEPSANFSADLTGDGNNDLIIVNTDSNSISVLFNNGDSTFAHNADYSVGLAPKSVYAADFTGDGDIDIAVANSGSNSVTVLYNDGTGTFYSYSRETYDTGGSSWGIFGADFNGDGNIDLAAANMNPDGVSILFNEVDGEFLDYINYPAGNLPYAITASDMDNDCDIDIAVANSGSNSVTVLYNDGSGTFSGTRATFGTGGRCRGIIGADFNNDGDIDLATANFDPSGVSVLLNNGNGGYPTHSDYSVGNMPITIKAADFDGDTDIDLAVSNSDFGDLALLLNDNTGNFPDSAVHYSAEGDSREICINDFDGDGTPDLAVTVSSPSGVSLLLNGTAAGGCDYQTGDVNGSDNYNGLDVTYGVAFLKGGDAPMCGICLPCLGWYYCGDVNGSCDYNGLDITYGVAFLKGGPGLVPCADCPPPGSAAASRPIFKKLNVR